MSLFRKLATQGRAITVHTAVAMVAGYPAEFIWVLMGRQHVQGLAGSQ